MNTVWRIVCICIGYLFGCILTAEIVARRIAGKSSSEIGTSGNPGMANIMAHLGFLPGIAVLAGDVLKCAAACLISWLLCGSRIGRICLYYAGLGTVIGHCFPFWRGFRGGKGVASGCIALVIYSPLWGLISCIAGMLTVFATQYLCLGGVVIPLVFMVISIPVFGWESGVLSAVLSAVCIIRHWSALKTIPSGTCERTDVLGVIRKKTGKKDKETREE